MPAKRPLLTAAALILLAGWWVWLCLPTRAVAPGDEAIYIYDGLLVSRGAMPYRDFFLAHPPLRVLASAALFALGLPALASKALAMLATLANGLLIGALAARCTPRSDPARATPELAGVAAAALWFGASLSLEIGAHFVGINLATTLSLAACLAAAHGRMGLAGALLGVGAHQALYALLPGPVLLAWAWRRGQVGRFVLGGLTWPVGALLLWWVVGDAYWAQTLGYHLRKVGTADKPWPFYRITHFLTWDWLPLVLAAGAAAAPAGQGGERRARWLLGLGLSVFALVCSYRALQAYYFVPPLALLCAAGGVGAVALVERLAPLPRHARPAWALAGLLFVLSTGPHVHGALQRRALLPAVAAELAQLTAVTEANRPASGLLWGDSAVTPLLALRTGMAIAANQVDTNDQRFRAGLIDSARVVRDVLERQRPGVFMVAHHGVFRVAPIRQHIERRFRAAYVFPTRVLGYEVVFLRHQDERP